MKPPPPHSKRAACPRASLMRPDRMAVGSGGTRHQQGHQGGRVCGSRSAARTHNTESTALRLSARAHAVTAAAITTPQYVRREEKSTACVMCLVCVSLCAGSRRRRATAEALPRLHPSARERERSMEVCLSMCVLYGCGLRLWSRCKLVRRVCSSLALDRTRDEDDRRLD